MNQAKGKPIRKRKCITGLCLCGMLFICPLMGLQAQQMPVYSQYRMNEFLFNPAIAGAEGFSSVNLIAREQWLGLPDSPKTHALAIQSRIMPNSFIFRGQSIRKRRGYNSRDSRVGLGAFIYNDRTGLLDRTGLQLTYAYHIRIQEGQLSFGLSANFYQFKVFVDGDHIILADDNDGTVNGNKRNLYVPDMNFGAYYMTAQYYAGFSATDLAQSSLKITRNKSSEYKALREYLLIGGYKYRVNYDLVIEPNTLLKVNEKGAIQGDFGAKALFGEDYWGGLAYRTPNSLIIMGGVKVDKFYFGYAFDYSFSQIQKYTFGTHEFMAAYRFGENARRYRWLNRF